MQARHHRTDWAAHDVRYLLVRQLLDVGKNHCQAIVFGQLVTLVTDENQRLEGKITFISQKAEFTPRNVQTADERSRLVYRIKVSTDNRAGVLKPGMPVEAEIPEV